MDMMQLVKTRRSALGGKLVLSDPGIPTGENTDYIATVKS